jgi:hypothetical protein
LRERPKLKRYYYAGGLMVLLGVGAALTGSGYKVGSLARMGPGFMPAVLGVVLAFLGILIAGTALGLSEADDKKLLPDDPQWFGWLCIPGGPVLLGPRFEENFRRSLLISRGDLTTFIERPISAFFLAISVLPIAAQIYVWLRKPKVLAGEKPIEADIPTTRYSELAG